jgi:hypothetical protein
MKPNNKHTFKVVATFTFSIKMKLLKLIFQDPVETTVKGAVIAVSNVKVAMTSLPVFVQTAD